MNASDRGPSSSSPAMPSAIAPRQPDRPPGATQRAARDGGAQRPAVQLVQAVRGDAHRQPERGQRRHQPAGVELRGEGRADRDVGQVPGRVRQVQERDVVAPAAGARARRRPAGRSARTAAAPDARSRRRATCCRYRTSTNPARSNAAASTGRRVARRRSGGCSGAGTGRRRARRARSDGLRAAARRRCRGARASAAARAAAGELEVAERRARLQHARQLGQRGVRRRRRSAAGRCT